MASMIEVRCISDDDSLEFKVVVRDGNGESRHHVTMARKTYEQLTADGAGIFPARAAGPTDGAR